MILALRSSIRVSERRHCRSLSRSCRRRSSSVAPWREKTADRTIDRAWKSQNSAAMSNHALRFAQSSVPTGSPTITSRVSRKRKHSQNLEKLQQQRPIRVDHTPAARPPPPPPPAPPPAPPAPPPRSSSS
jgi:hypothetical protein